MVRRTNEPPDIEIYAIELEVLPVAGQPVRYEIQRTFDDLFGSPDLNRLRTVAEVTAQDPRYVDRLPNDGATWHYRCRAVADGWTSSAWTDWVSGSATALPGGSAEIWEMRHVTGKVPIISDTTGADRLLITAPQVATDSAGNSALEDGDSITFTGYDNPPQWWASPTGLVWETTLTDGDTTIREVRLENITSTGADVVAELQQATGSATNRDENFAGAASPITTVGGTADSDNITAAQVPAHNDSFTIRGAVKFSNTADPLKGGNAWGNLAVKVYSYDAGLSAATLRDTLTVESELVLAPDTDTTVAWSTTISAPDVDGDVGDRFRIEASAFNAFGPSAAKLTFALYGKNSAGYTTNGVAWQELTTTSVSATDATVGATVGFLLIDADNIA